MLAVQGVTTFVTYLAYLSLLKITPELHGSVDHDQP